MAFSTDQQMNVLELEILQMARAHGSHTPHHWCLKPEYYQQMGKIPEDIQEILAIYGKYEVLIRIEPECLIERWGN